MIPLLLHDTSLAQIFIVFAYRGCYFFFFFLEISCKYFQMSRIIIEILTDNWIFTSVKSTIDKYKIYYIINNL